MSHHTTRKVVAGTLAALTIATLTACSSSDDGGGSTSPETATAEQIEAALQEGADLTLWSWGTALPDQVAAFEAKYPNVTVDLQNVGTGNDQYQKLQNAAKAGKGIPDVAQIEYMALPQFVLGETVMDVSPYGMTDNEDLFTESTWGSVAIMDGLYGMPVDSGPLVFWYRKDIFDSLGLQAPTTWDEYAAAAKAIHDANPEAYIANDAGGDASSDLAQIWAAGGRPFSVDGTNVTIDLADPGTTKWADMWGGLINDGLINTEITPWSDAWFTALGNGQLTSLLMGAWASGVFTSSLPDAAGQWAVAPVPTFDDGISSGSEHGGSSFAVMKNGDGKNALAAVGLQKWLTTDPEALQIAIDNGGFPSTIAELTSPEFKDAPQEYFGGQAINQVLVEAAQNVGTGWNFLPYEVYADSIWGDSVGQQIADHGDLATGLSGWQDALVSYGQAQGFTVNK